MTGLLVGPILAGVVVEQFGFYELQLILSKCCTLLYLSYRV